MPNYTILPGSTSERLLVQIVDSTTALGKTGLVYNTSGLQCYYVRPGSAATSVTLSTQTVTGAYSSGGFVEIDATNMPGIYRFDPPDAAIAAGVRGVRFIFKGTDILEAPLEVSLNAQVNTVQVAGTAQTGRDIGASVLLSSGTGTGQVSLSSGRVNSDVVYVNGSAVNTSSAQLGVNVVNAGGTAWASGAITAASIATDAITAGKIAADAIGASELAADAVNEITAAIKALVIETNGSITVGQALSLILAACSGVTASGGTVLKDPSGTSTRITATVNGSNERTAMTVTPSA